VGLAKALTATDQGFTTGSDLAIGEVATYLVTLTIPEGVTPNAQLVDTLPAGLAIVGVDSITHSSTALVNNYTASGSASVTVNSNTIAGLVFLDANDDGRKQATDPPPGGASVLLTGLDNLGNTVSTTAITNSSGAYSFGSLRPGSYALAMTPPGGYLDGKDTVGATFGGTNPSPDVFSGLTIPLGTNAVGSGYNFAELPPASVAGTVFSDTNNNGSTQAGEPGLAGTTVTLPGTDLPGNPVVRTTTTDAGGYYLFTGLDAGTYNLVEALPAGYLAPRNGMTSITGIALGAGSSNIVNNFAASPPASLSGSVYLDDNRDGVYQPGEFGIAHATITLVGSDDLGRASTLRTTTDDYGQYRFDGLRPGIYAIQRAPVSIFADGAATAGTLGESASPDAIAGIAVGAGHRGSGSNFGEFVIPACKLNTPAFRAAPASGPRPFGPVAFGGQGAPGTGFDPSLPQISRYPPTLVGEYQAERANPVGPNRHQAPVHLARGAAHGPHALDRVVQSHPRGTAAHPRSAPRAR